MELDEVSFAIGMLLGILVTGCVYILSAYFEDVTRVNR